MSKFKIDRNYAMPIRTSSIEYPFNDMEVGDSFFVASESRKIDSLRGRISSAARMKGIKVATRKIDGGLRVWRA